MSIFRSFDTVSNPMDIAHGNQERAFWIPTSYDQKESKKYADDQVTNAPFNFVDFDAKSNKNHMDEELSIDFDEDLNSSLSDLEDEAFEEENIITESMLEEAKKEAYERGKNDGLREAQEEMDKELLRVTKRKQEFIEVLLFSFDKKATEIDKILEYHKNYLSSVFSEVAYNLLPGFVEVNLADKIPVIVEKNISLLSVQKRLEIHLHSDSFKEFHSEIEDILKKNNPSLQLSFIEDDAIHRGDVTIIWPDGELFHSNEVLKNEIVDLFYSFFQQHKKELTDLRSYDSPPVNHDKELEDEISMEEALDD